VSPGVTWAFLRKCTVPAGSLKGMISGVGFGSCEAGTANCLDFAAGVGVAGVLLGAVSDLGLRPRFAAGVCSPSVVDPRVLRFAVLMVF